MKRPIAIMIACAFPLGAALPAQATGAKPNDRFANTEPLEPMARSRSDALAWCVRLVGKNTDEWLGELRSALIDYCRPADDAAVVRASRATQIAKAPGRKR